MGLWGILPPLFLALLGTPLFIVIAASGLLSLYSEGIDLSAIFICWRPAKLPGALSVSPMPFWAGFRAVWRSSPCWSRPSSRLSPEPPA